jgi:hypothetical protein
MPTLHALHAMEALRHTTISRHGHTPARRRTAIPAVLLLAVAIPAVVLLAVLLAG